MIGSVSRHLQPLKGNFKHWQMHKDLQGSLSTLLHPFRDLWFQISPQLLKPLKHILSVIFLLTILDTRVFDHLIQQKLYFYRFLKTVYAHYLSYNWYLHSYKPLSDVWIACCDNIVESYFLWISLLRFFGLYIISFI